MRRGLAALSAGTLLCALIAIISVPAASAKVTTPQVLYVGNYHGISTPAAQTFTSIQAAVNAAHKGDWILIAPGDYKEQADVANPPTPSDLAVGWYGGVDVETANLHLRGMDRNGVVVDGTNPGAPQCSNVPGDQNFLGGDGRNGILVWEANGVSIDNLTVCNFQSGSGVSGNEIWWNGGATSGKIHLKGYSGSYLTATSTYFANSDPSHPAVCSTCATYGIFANDAQGPALLSQTYASNMSDSGLYIGACQRSCNVTVDQSWFEYSALGYSGTNSGGAVIVQNSRFDNNKDGFDTNTALTGDPPPPQDGKCKGGPSAITGTMSCWVFQNNLVDDNNNPNTPVYGTAGLGPTGTGMTVSGGRDDTIMNNEFVNNGAWGILFAPYPDGNTTSGGKTCTGEKGIIGTSLGLGCLFDPMNDVLLNNKFSGNGTLGNPSNADFGNLVVGGNEPTNCFSGNTEWDSTFTTPMGAATNANVLDGNASQTPTACGTKTVKVKSKSNPTGLLGANTDSTLLVQVECDAGVLTGALCSGTYPQTTSVVMHPLPTLPTMPNPCVGAPSNLWCPGGSPAPAPAR